MLIKYQALTQVLKREKTPLYVLFGQDHYLLNESAKQIKAAWHEDSDNQTLHLNTAADWRALFEEANSYSLFSKYTLIDAHFDKKTFDATSKEAIHDYLKRVNNNCLVIIRAPLIPAKQLQWINANNAVTVIQATSFDKAQWQRFIADKLTMQSIRFEPSIPALIYQYTQGNLLASMQLIDKLVIVHEPNELLIESMVLEQLIDQCDYQLYELTDACLAKDHKKIIHLLRQAAQNRTEPTLILWFLTQEIRQLIALSYLVSQNVSIANACQQLRIWNQRANLYANILTNASLSSLKHLLSMGQAIDEQIKSNQNKQVWHNLEQLALLIAA